MSTRDGRPRAARRTPEERRADIAAAARAVALADGLAAVTLRSVAARAGVAPALVAHYAADGMDALVAATFDGIVGGELAEVSGLVAAAGSPRAALAAMIRTLAGGERDAVTAVWVEAWALGRRSEPVAIAVRAQMDAWQRLVQGVVEAGVRAGEFDAADPAEAAWQVLAMIDGTGAQALVRWGATGDRADLLLRAVEGMLAVAR